jgi:hypothetical protein
MTPCRPSVTAFALAVTLLSACAGSVDYIPGTKVPRGGDNEAIIARVEAYRLAVERRDAPAVLLMAARGYWDDAGTPGGEDDYGFAGLKKILSGRFQTVDDVRYSMRYVGLRRLGNRAFVDVLVDASFTLKDARGAEVRRDMRDQNQLVLEWNGESWMFLSGL